MSACPNTNSPEWKALVESFIRKGSKPDVAEATAHAVFKLNGEDVPTFDEALKLLDGIKPIERDEQVARYSDKLKKERAEEQLATLTNMRDRITNPAQKETLTKVITMVNSYLQFLNRNIALAEAGQPTVKTISVSNFIGSADFKGDPLAYDAFKQFGIFMHEVLEKAQVQALEYGIPIVTVLTREFFEEAYAEFVAKAPFEIPELTVDTMYAQAVNMAMHIKTKSDARFLILPEVTIAGANKQGSLVIGRLDLMMVDPEGKVHVFDFKTKKVRNCVREDDDTGEVYMVEDRVMVHLAKQNFAIDRKEGTAVEFMAKQRSTFDTWMLQTKVYENILGQHGIDTGNSTILGLMYEVDPGSGRFQDAMFGVFDIPNFYTYARYTVVPGDNGLWKTDPDAQEREMMKLRDIVDQEIPVSKEQEKKNKEKEVKLLDFTPTPENNKMLIENLRASVESELDDIAKQIAELDRKGEKDTARRELLYARKKTLMDFDQVLLRTDDTSKGHSVNFSLVMDYVEADLKMMERMSDEAIAAYRATNDQRERLEHVTQIMTAFRKTRGMYDIVSALREIVDEARGTKKDLQNSEVVKKLENLNAFNDRIESNFREAGLAMGVMILRTPGKKVFEGVKRDMEEGALPKLAKLKEEYEALKQGKARGIFSQLKNSMLSFVSQRMKDGIAAKLDNNGEGLMNDVMALEQKIKRMEAFIMHGLDYTEESIAAYISGVTDPKSDIYIGASDVFNNSVLMAGLGQTSLNPGSLIASVSDSELAISAFTQMYKNAQAQAQYNLQNNLVLLNFDKMRDGLLKRMSLDQLNDLISEWRTIKTIDDKTGETVERRMLYMVKPFSEEYEQTYRNFQQDLRRIKKEISETNKAYNQAFAEYRKAVKELKTNPASDTIMAKIKEMEALKDEAEKALLDKKREREILTDKQMDWMMANCSLPFSDAFYKYQRMLPQDIRDQLQKKYLEKQVITHQEGAGNEIMLDENDFDRLKELDTEIRKLREEAKKRDPKYAQYIDEFNNLYEYDININFFERMRDNAKTRFADHPELWQKWLKNNTIDTPTKRQALEPIQQGSYVSYNGLVYNIEEVNGDVVTLMDYDTGETKVAPVSELEGLNWYDELNTLYKIRAEIYGRNPEIEALMERKREIMRPHKDAGRFDPQFLTEEETDELDGINAAMEQIFEESEMPELSEEDREVANTIRERIKNISQKRINPNYTDLFNRKMQTLESAYKNMIQAESQLATAVGKGDTKTISKTTKDLAFFRSQFDVVEAEFEKWYNMTHDNEYKSIRDGYDVRGNVSPKAFNFELVPSPGVADKYMDYAKPHPKYKIKRLKETAKNPNFLQSADGIPMPQGVVKDAQGHFQVMPGFESSTNISSKYRSIMADPEIFAFYNKMMDAFFDQQKKIEGRRIGYMVPGYSMSTIESISRDGVLKSFERQWDLFIDKNIRKYGAQDRVENTFGDLGGRIRMRYTEQLPEELQSQDAVGALLKYTLEAEYNIAMQQVTPMADAFIEYLELLSEDLKKTIQAGKTTTIDPVTNKRKLVDMSRRQRELDGIIDQMKFERRKFAYGQEETDNEATRLIKKRMNMIFKYTSFIRMGFDAANQMKNFVSGNVQAWIAAGNHDSDHYGRNDMLWAKGKIYGYDGFLHNWFADWGKVSDISDSTMLYRMYNPTQKDFASYLDEVSGGRGRRAKATMLGVQEMGYMIQDKGDTEVALTVMYSVLNHYKFAKIKGHDSKGEPILETDEKGETVMIPAHEAYTRGANNILERRSDVLFDQEDENRLRNIIYSEMRRAQGNYASSDQTKFEETVVGKLVFFYRKYLVPQMLNRFGYLRPNWEAGEAALGYWRAVAMSWKYYGSSNTLKHFILGTKLAKKMGSTVDLINVTDKSGRTVQRQGDLYTRKIAQARRDAFVMAMMTILSMMLMSYIRRKDDDDEEIGMLEGNALRIFWGTKGEVLSMFPLGGGSDEYIRNFTSLTVYTRELNAVKRMGSHTWNLVFAMLYNGGEEPDPDVDGETAYQTWKDAFYTRKSGRFEEGDAKIIKDIEDLTGIRNFRDIFDPSDRVQQMKRNQ
jgi:hypothetical protein